jgi:hypothetical protein
MKGLNRRRFLQLTGTGSIVAATAGAAVPLLSSAPRLTSTSQQGTFTFRAVAGLPSKELPTYASYVLEGHVDLSARTGVIANTIYAGEPQAMSRIAIPGQSRIFRITDVENLGGSFRLVGTIEDSSQLQRGESRTITLLLDPAQRQARATLWNSEMLLQLVE